ncbi:hypothetical protein BDFB_013097 [Asbolus verrucosus]|uniref:Uncharacterized protein n=1 Tax=Asbolus verrucosus TaxID=1661398 RepID=A0A482VMP6_ASBVE|nr:hypothetical protein BDFB_013097 [Asbolus verrucosus]
MVFTTEHKIFITECYVRNGVIENGECRCSSSACLQEFRQKFEDMVFLEADFFNLVRSTVKNFPLNGSVNRKQASGGLKLRTEALIEDVRQRMEEEPTRSLKHLSQEMGLSYETCLLRKRI